MQEFAPSTQLTSSIFPTFRFLAETYHRMIHPHRLRVQTSLVPLRFWLCVLRPRPPRSGHRALMLPSLTTAVAPLVGIAPMARQPEPGWPLILALLSTSTQ